MAIYNEILSGRFAKSLQKIFSMKGTNPTKQLGGELMPVLPMFYGREARFLESWNSWGFWITIAAVAANLSGLRLRNPAGSGVIAVIEKIELDTAVADQFFIRQGSATTDLGTILTLNGNRLDARIGVSPAPTSVLSGQNNAAAVPALTGQFTLGAPHMAVNTQYNFVQTDIQELPLLPGDALQFVPTAVNEALNVAMIFRERPLEESERQ